ncbi:MAG: hypothetical protein JO090_02225 [Rhizobacter sp.]|nr:hypothetical protein [Rhizobacter sp.]
MAIKLLGHVWRSAATVGPTGRRSGNDWVVEVREPSHWNPVIARGAMAADNTDASATEPVWAETQPWCHD